MLYVVSSDKNDYPWRVGAPFRDISWDTVLEIQADGDELAYLYNRFPGLPRVENYRVVSFVGDWAKFIVANMI